MYSCHNTAVFIVVARAACGLQVPTLRRPQDGRKWSAGKFKDMSAHQRDEAHNGGCTPESVLNYLEIWIRRPSSIYMAFSRGLGVKKKTKLSGGLSQKSNVDPGIRVKFPVQRACLKYK